MDTDSRAQDPGAWPLARLMGVRIAAVGSYLPQRVVTNAELAEQLGFDADWILQRTGIRERRCAAPHEATSDLAIHAGRQCLERAGAGPRDVDLLILATASPDAVGPACACLVQEGLGLRCGAFDVMGACSGFTYALITAAQFVGTGCCRHVLVVGADCMTRVMNPHDMKSFPLFGDGAGAVLVTRGEPDQGLLAFQYGSEGSGQPLLTRPMGGSRIPPDASLFAEDLQYMHMDGKPVFKWAVQLLAETVPGVVRHAGLTPDELDLVAFHQANIRILHAAADYLGIDPGKLVVNLDRYGNTTGGSVPLALDEAQSTGRLKRGTTVLVSGFGAGLAFAHAVLRW